jgi:ribosomal protein S27E
MRDGSTGRFERLQCVKCGAHALVPPSAAASAICDVCGGRTLVPLDDVEPRVENLSHLRRGQA